MKKDWPLRWQPGTSNGLACHVKTPWGWVEVTEGAEFILGDHVWEVRYFETHEMKVVCEVDKSLSGASICLYEVAEHLATLQYGAALGTDWGEGCGSC